MAFALELLLGIIVGVTIFGLAVAIMVETDRETLEEPVSPTLCLESGSSEPWVQPRPGVRARQRRMKNLDRLDMIIEGEEDAEA